MSRSKWLNESLYLCNSCCKVFESRAGKCTSCGSSNVEKIFEGYEERGRRDGTGPYKYSAQRSMFGDVGVRKMRGEPCPYDAEDLKKDGQVANIVKEFGPESAEVKYFIAGKYSIDPSVVDEIVNVLKDIFKTSEPDLEEQRDEDSYVTVGKGLEKEDAEKLAADKGGLVVTDEENKDKFSVIVKKEKKV